MTLAILCPGQGSQHVGMGLELARESAEAGRVFEEADALLGFALSDLMWEGPMETLTETHNAQPALLTHSVAAYRALRAGGMEASAFVAGHSLGEFTAHVVAGTMEFGDALRLVRLRGELMSAAGRASPGTMAAVLGLADDVVETECASVEEGVCVPANYNCEGQVVLSGDLAGIAEGIERVRSAGAKRAIELKVAGAFHSPLMTPAADGLRERLESVAFRDPEVPVVANVTAQAVIQGAEARRLLVEQLTSPVRWAASIATMVAQGADQFLEVGPGTVLCGLNRRNAPGFSCTSVSSHDDVLGYLETRKEDQI